MKKSLAYRLGALANTIVLTGAMAVSTFALQSSAAQAQAFPEKPIQLIVPYRAGGGTDTMARVFARAMTSELGQPVVVVNHKGGGGAVGGSVLANSTADGYTIMLGGDDIPSYIPHSSDVDFAYDSFQGIAAIAEYQNAFIAKAGAPYTTFAEFVEHAKANPGVKLGHVGGITQLFIESMVSQADIDARVITTAGGSEVVQFLLAGQIDAGYSGGIHNANPEQWEVLGSFNEARLPSSPDKPTFKEAGFGMSMPAKLIVLAPAGLPEAVADALEGAIEAASQDADFRTIVEDRLKAPVTFVSSADLNAYLADLNTNMAALVE
ncbi:MAG: tripartite tricarboxylate transporter substrate binding protein [Albidovulum sp.]